MRICVDDKVCMRHGQCVIAAPALFSFAPDGSLQVVADPDESLRLDAEDAADACPEQAITIED